MGLFSRKKKEEPKPAPKKEEPKKAEAPAKAEPKPAPKPEPKKEEKKPAAKPAPKKDEKKPAAKPAPKKEEKAEADNKNGAYFVSTHPDGGWQVKKAGAQKALKKFKTKAEAEEYAKTVAKNQDTNVVRKKKDGKIQKKR